MKIKIIIVSVLFCSVSRVCGQSIWSEPSLKKNSLLFYSGSGALGRHVESNYLNASYSSYLKTPIISAGFDYCFASTDMSLWGMGAYVSSSIGRKSYDGLSQQSRLWSNTLVALKLTHHNKFFVTNKIDVCSGYIIGTRLKNYHDESASNTRANDNRRFVAGISAMIKYYVTKKTSVFGEFALGHNVDLLHIGLSRKMK